MSKVQLIIKRHSEKAQREFKSVKGQSIKLILEVVDYPDLIEKCWEVLKHKSVYIKEIQTFNSNYYLLRIQSIFERSKNANALALSFYDINDLKSSEKMIEHSKDLIELVSKNANLGIWNWYINDDILEWNDGMFDLFSVPRKQFSGVYDDFIRLIKSEDRESVKNATENALQKNVKFDVEFRVDTLSKEIKYIQAKGEYYKGVNGFSDRLTGLCFDTTPIKMAEKKLKRMALYDSVTGIPNRNNFLNALKAAISRSNRSHNRFAVLFIDLDNFKQINDAYGHHVGDLLLSAISSRISHVLRVGDFFARISGDEFAIIVENILDVQDLNIVVNRCLDISQDKINIGSHVISQTLSIGISIYPDSAKTPDKLLQYADTAMYHAKEKGKNNFVYFRSELDEKIQRKNKIEIALRDSSSLDNFELYYQPQIELATEKVVGVEALLRWKNPSLGNPSPEEFISIAENNRSINVLGDWVIEQAFKDFNILCGVFNNANLKLSINISTVQLNSLKLLSYVQNKIKQYSICAKNIIFEVTESKLMRDALDVTKVINGLAQLGILFAIDDFGKGYSSMNYLKLLPVKYLKIDKSFIIELEEDNKAIVKAMLALARQLKMISIAEGVEELSHLEFLKANGCAEAQGYFFAKPMSLSDLNLHYHPA